MIWIIFWKLYGPYDSFNVRILPVYRYFLEWFWAINPSHIILTSESAHLILSKWYIIILSEKYTHIWSKKGRAKRWIKGTLGYKIFIYQPLSCTCNSLYSTCGKQCKVDKPSHRVITMVVKFVCEGVGILIISLVGLVGNVAMITNYARKVFEKHNRIRKMIWLILGK